MTEISSIPRYSRLLNLFSHATSEDMATSTYRQDWQFLAWYCAALYRFVNRDGDHQTCAPSWYAPPQSHS